MATNRGNTRPGAFEHEREAQRRAQPAGDTDEGVRVVSRPAAFRRAGYAFSAEPTEIRASDITVGQLEDLMSEPQLVVTPIRMDPPAAEAKE